MDQFAERHPDRGPYSAPIVVFHADGNAVGSRLPESEDDDKQQTGERADR